MQNITNSLLLPDKTLQFVKDHPLMADPVLPVGHGPRLTARDVNYTQIIVERVTALDNNVYDVLFTGTGKCVCECVWSQEFVFYEIWRILQTSRINKIISVFLMDV